MLARDDHRRTLNWSLRTGSAMAPAIIGIAIGGVFMTLPFQFDLFRVGFRMSFIMDIQRRTSKDEELALDPVVSKSNRAFRIIRSIITSTFRVKYD